MKQKRSICILGGLLVLLVVVYAGLHIYNGRQEEKEAEEAKADQVYLVKEEVPETFSYTNEGTKETMSFTKKDGTWQYDQDPETTLNQDTIENLAVSVSVCPAVRELSDPDERSDYGLDQPSYTIHLTTDGDGQKTIYIGTATGEDYYAAVEGEDTVYTIDSTLVSALVYDLSTLAELDTVPSIGSGNLKRVEVTENGETKTYDSEEDLADLAGGFGVLALTTVSDYHMSETDAGKYGLDEASRITAKAAYKDTTSKKKKTFTMYVGKTDDTGEARYVMVQDSDIVYTVAKDTVENCIQTQ